MNEITYKPIIVTSNRRKDGSYLVYIRICFKKKVKRLSTNLLCQPTDLTRSLKIKNQTILDKADALIKQMRKVTDNFSQYDLEPRDVEWVVNKIKDGLAGDNFSLDFFEWGEKYIKTKNLSTRKAYERALNAFERFLGKRVLDINDISKMMLLDFMEFVDDEPKMHYNRKTKEWEETKKKKVAKASSSLHLMKLQHIFNAAKDRYNDEDADMIRIPRSPFSTIKKVFPSGGKGQKALSKEVMQAIISAKTKDKQIRVALDAFIVSFALMGANLADLFAATPFKGDEWVYNRLKTADRRDDNAEMKVKIPPQIREHLERLQKGHGTKWWLKELHRLGEKKHTCNCKINDLLRKWQKEFKEENEDEDEMELDDFTFYAARHTWATLARAMGFDLAIVNDCLCHKDSLDDGRRYAPSSWEKRNAVNKAVVESFVWE
jgi:integrase